MPGTRTLRLAELSPSAAAAAALPVREGNAQARPPLSSGGSTGGSSGPTSGISVGAGSPSGAPARRAVRRARGGGAECAYAPTADCQAAMLGSGGVHRRGVGGGDGGGGGGGGGAGGPMGAAAHSARAHALAAAQDVCGNWLQEVLGAPGGIRGACMPEPLSARASAARAGAAVGALLFDVGGSLVGQTAALSLLSASAACALNRAYGGVSPRELPVAAGGGWSTGDLFDSDREGSSEEERGSVGRAASSSPDGGGGGGGGADGGGGAPAGFRGPSGESLRRAGLVPGASWESKSSETDAFVASLSRLRGAAKAAHAPRAGAQPPPPRPCLFKLNLSAHGANAVDTVLQLLELTPSQAARLAEVGAGLRVVPSAAAAGKGKGKAAAAAAEAAEAAAAAGDAGEEFLSSWQFNDPSEGGPSTIVEAVEAACAAGAKHPEPIGAVYRSARDAATFLSTLRAPAAPSQEGGASGARAPAASSPRDGAAALSYAAAAAAAPSAAAGAPAPAPPPPPPPAGAHGNGWLTRADHRDGVDHVVAARAFFTLNPPPVAYPLSTSMGAAVLAAASAVAEEGAPPLPSPPPPPPLPPPALMFPVADAFTSPIVNALPQRAASILLHWAATNETPIAGLPFPLYNFHDAVERVREGSGGGLTAGSGSTPRSTPCSSPLLAGAPGPGFARGRLSGGGGGGVSALGAGAGGSSGWVGAGAGAASGPQAGAGAGAPQRDGDAGEMLGLQLSPLAGPQPSPSKLPPLSLG